MLEQLDVVIASVHARHRASPSELTARLQRVLSLPIFKIWWQLYLYDLFEAGAQDTLYTRNAVLIALDDTWAVGAQFELSWVVKKARAEDCLRSAPVGGVANLQVARWLTLGGCHRRCRALQVLPRGEYYPATPVARQERCWAPLTRAPRR